MPRSRTLQIGLLGTALALVTAGCGPTAGRGLYGAPGAASMRASFIGGAAWSGGDSVIDTRNDAALGYQPALLPEGGWAEVELVDRQTIRSSGRPGGYVRYTRRTVH